MTNQSNVVIKFNQMHRDIAGYVASTCNPASGRRGEVDGLRLGLLLSIDAC